MEIVSKTGVHAFTVELATNDAERSRGLMFRRELPEGRGMLFDFERDQPVGFWMHNTYISLDMIFIRGDGRIAHIAENTEPMSDRLIPSGGPVPPATMSRAQFLPAAAERAPSRTVLAAGRRNMYPTARRAGYSAAW